MQKITIAHFVYTHLVGIIRNGTLFNLISYGAKETFGRRDDRLIFSFVTILNQHQKKVIYMSVVLN